MTGLTTPVRNIATYRNPIRALLNGEPVSLIATGDQEGHSPVCQYVDMNTGSLNWASQSAFTIIDQNFVSEQALRQITQSFGR